MPKPQLKNPYEKNPDVEPGEAPNVQRYQLIIRLLGDFTVNVDATEQVVRNARLAFEQPNGKSLEVWSENEHILIKPSAITALFVRPPLPT